MTKHEWVLSKDIPGYDGRYAVTADGRVWAYPRTVNAKNGSTRVRKGRWMVLDQSSDYTRVPLHNGTRRTLALVHRLVAQAFLSNPDNKPEVNHDDGNTRHNWWRNLEWMTHAENVRHAIANGLSNPTANLSWSRS